MDSSAWYQLSMWLLRFGFLFMIAFGVCAVKFDLVSMIKSEINERKNRRFLDNESYFAYVEEKNKENDEESPSFQMETAGMPSQKPHSPENTFSASVPNPTVREAPPSGTVVTHRTEKETPPPSGTVVTHRSAQKQETSNEFVLLENIMVIHGNPELIQKVVS